MAIHPTVIIDPSAEIHESCDIGPYVIIGPEVKMGADNKVDSHAVFQGPTVIGEGNHFFPSTMIGLNPQSIAYKGERNTVRIGDRNVFREMVQVHRSMFDGGETRIGNDNFIMGNSHIAHDCILHNNIIFANSATLAGHVEVFDRAFLSGFVGVVQFRKVGCCSLLSVHTRVVKDIPPYVISMGEHGYVAGLNMVGLRRAGISQKDRREIKRVYKLYFRSGLSVSQAHEKAEHEVDMKNHYVMEFINFIKNSKYGIPRALSAGEQDDME